MSTLVHNRDTPWLCLRHPMQDIFYWVHSKCACSYYKNILSRLLWKRCTTKDISWGQSKVFSHIRDPIKKHRTGLIEYFYYHKCQHILRDNENNDDFWLMLSRAPWLDVHSMSIWEHLGEKSDLVNWIPIDKPDFSHLDSTLDYIGFTDDRSLMYKQPVINASTGFKKECVNRLLGISPDPLITKYLEQDQQIYDFVIRDPGFEPMKYQQKLSELLRQGVTREFAESILDQDVATGAYLDW